MEWGHLKKDISPSSEKIGKGFKFNTVCAQNSFINHLGWVQFQNHLLQFNSGQGASIDQTAFQTQITQWADRLPKMKFCH